MKRCVINIHVAEVIAEIVLNICIVVTSAIFSICFYITETLHDKLIVLFGFLFLLSGLFLIDKFEELFVSKFYFEDKFVDKIV